jgi:hypothetical protein
VKVDDRRYVKPFRTFERFKAKEAQALEKQRALRDLLSERYHDDRSGMESATYDAFGTVYGRILDDLAVLEHRDSHPCAQLKHYIGYLRQYEARVAAAMNRFEGSRNQRQYKVLSEGPAALQAVREQIAKREVELEQYSDEDRAAEPEPVNPNDNWFVRLEQAAEEAEEREFAKPHPPLHEPDAMERFAWMKIQTPEEMRAFLDGSPEFFNEPEGWEPEETCQRWRDEEYNFVMWICGKGPTRPSPEAVDAWNVWESARSHERLRLIQLGMP